MNPYQGQRKPPMPRHTLPVKWDGEPIIWDTWTPTDGIIICGHGYHEKPYHCPHCKTRAHPKSITGEVLSQPIISLVLYRCMTCGYTTIMSLAATPGSDWQVWVLDKDDYSDAGSHDKQEMKNEQKHT